MLRRAAVGIARRDLDHVLVDMVAVGVVQVPVVQVIQMVAVLDRNVSAVGAMTVRVIGMLRVRAWHGWPPCSAGKRATIRKIAPRRHPYGPRWRGAIM
jgi:hypothetical protein